MVKGCLIAEMWFSLLAKEKTTTFQSELTKPWRKCSGKNNVFYVLDHGKQHTSSVHSDMCKEQGYWDKEQNSLFSQHLIFLVKLMLTATIKSSYS